MERTALESSVGGIERGRRRAVSRRATEIEAGVDSLQAALYIPRRDGWVNLVAPRAHSDHVVTRDCSLQYTCSGLLSCLFEFALGRCQNKAHHHFRRSSELVGGGGQDMPAESHMDHIGLAATGTDDLRVDRMVGRWSSLPWSTCRLRTRVVIRLAK